MTSKETYNYLGGWFAEGDEKGVCGELRQESDQTQGAARLRTVRGFQAVGSEYAVGAVRPSIKIGDFVRVLENPHAPLLLRHGKTLGNYQYTSSCCFAKGMEGHSVEMRRDCAGCIYTLKHDDSFIYNIPEDCVELVQPTEQTEAEKTDTDNIVDDFAKVMEGYRKVFADIADNFDWMQYEADLAKEIAVKLSKPNENKPGYVADYAVSVAKAVVENLKKK